MSESEKRLKANKVIAGKKCGWCREPLAFGDDAVICRDCKLLHHADCWDDKGGCARPDCVNAPLERVRSNAPPQRDRSRRAGGKVACPHCGRDIGANVRACPFCRGEISAPVSRRATRGQRYRQRNPAEEPMTGVDWALCIFCSTIGCILGIVYLCQGKTKKGGIMIAVSMVVQILIYFIRESTTRGRLR